VKSVATLLGVAMAVGALAAPAAAQDPRPVTRLDVAPVGHRLTAKQAQAIADRLPKIVAERRKYPGSYAGVFLKGPTRWQVSYYSRATPPKEIGQVIVDDATGGVLEAWTGYQVAWTMARGYPGAFGRKVNALWIWLPLSVLFIAPFVDVRRRRLCLVHLDLLVLLAFGVSLAFFNAGRIGVSTPLVAPLLAYLLARMLCVGLRRGRERVQEREPLRLAVPVAWLAVAVVFLLGFRIGLNLTNSNVIDVGYSGVVGADRLAKGENVYGAFPRDDPRGDTYGPVVYEAYVPFEQALPWHGAWDELPAAHAAAIFFDLLCVALLYLLGRRVRGPTLGVVLAYCWVAYPFTLYASNTNSNDALVAALVLSAVAFAARPAARGALAALAALTKIAPLGLAPVLATHRRDRSSAVFAAGFAAAGALALAPFLLDGESVRTIYDRTLGYQAGRSAPFSIWGLYGLRGLQDVWRGGTVLLALALAFVPRRRDIAGLAALCAAVLIALELGATYWFYLYIVWFFPLVVVALLGRYGAPPRAPARREPAVIAAFDLGAIDCARGAGGRVGSRQ
jgi:hypothetical protein